MLGRKIPTWAAICLALLSAFSSAFAVWVLVSLKVIRGTALVEYRGDINIIDFKFISDREVSVTISTTLSPTPACTITISGAGITGSRTIPAGWSSPYTLTIPISGTLTQGTIIIEITT